MHASYPRRALGSGGWLPEQGPAFLAARFHATVRTCGGDAKNRGSQDKGIVHRAHALQRAVAGRTRVAIRSEPRRLIVHLRSKPPGKFPFAHETTKLSTADTRQ